MSDFETWWKKQGAQFRDHNGHRTSCSLTAEEAYLAGQASAEQRVESLKRANKDLADENAAAWDKCVELEQRVNELEGDCAILRHAYAELESECRTLVRQNGEWQAKCAELERERETMVTQDAFVAVTDLLKAQAGEPLTGKPVLGLTDYEALTRKELIALIDALKAQAGEPEPTSFHPDWSLLEASQDSLREHMARIKELERELEGQKKANGFLALNAAPAPKESK